MREQIVIFVSNATPGNRPGLSAGDLFSLLTLLSTWILAMADWLIVHRSPHEPQARRPTHQSVRRQVYPDAMDYTSTQLARLAHADAAHELSERLVSLASTYADGYGRGAFLTEDAAQVVNEASQLLVAAVVADRLRGVSWADVGEALGVTKQTAHERFAAGEREFREALLFPHRYPENGGLGYTVAPYAVEQPDRVRERLDAWVVERRRSSGPDRDEPLPATRGLEAMGERDRWTTDRMGQVLVPGRCADSRPPAGRRHARAG